MTIHVHVCTALPDWGGRGYSLDWQFAPLAVAIVVTIKLINNHMLSTPTPPTHPLAGAVVSVDGGQVKLQLPRHDPHRSQSYSKLVFTTLYHKVYVVCTANDTVKIIFCKF